VASLRYSKPSPKSSGSIESPVPFSSADIDATAPRPHQ
jgi:hypothetical protein